MKKGKLFWLLITLLAIFASLFYDIYIVKGISFIRNQVFNDFFMGITFASSGIIIFFILTSLFLWRDKKRKWIIPLWMTLGISGLVGYILKVLVNRARPFQLGIISTFPALANTGHMTWNASFPSFHAMLGFCALPILSKEFPKFKYVWLLFAALIAFSRVYFGLHFLSDVIAGGLIGYLIGIAIVHAENKSGFGEKINKFIIKLWGKIIKK